MFETLFLFLAIFVLEVILEIDNITALRKAAEGLPNTPLCQGQMPHALALGVRVILAYVLFNAVAIFSRIPSTGGHGNLEQLGGMLIVVVASGLIINYMNGGRTVKANLSRRITNKKTDLGSFLVADAFLSLDTVIAAVAMTTNFGLAVVAMISAAVCIMLFNKPLHAWLKVNPRMALMAFIVIGLLGFNLILDSHGIHIPKYVLLVFVGFGLYFDNVGKANRSKRADSLARAKERASGAASQVRGVESHLVETINKIADYTAPVPEQRAPRVVVPRVVVPKTIESTWAEVVQKSEDTRDVLAAEQAKAGGAFDYAPDGKKIAVTAAAAAVASSGLEEMMAFKHASTLDGYVFGTSHGAGVEPGRYGFIFMGAKANPLCIACGIEQPRIFSICDRCGHYRFLCPAGIFEVGSLRLLTMRA
jgi:predicted tellurium resistance membrane protein TerC